MRTPDTSSRPATSALIVFAMLSATAFAGDGIRPDESDPSRVSAPPAHAIGFPSRDPQLDVLPGFQTPPPGYGEVAFYWWLGDPLTKPRLAWEIEQLAGKGVMGLQINYAHSDRGGRSYGLTLPSNPPLFSEEWWNLVGWFLGAAKQHGMSISLSDYTLGVGQGWRVDEVLKEHPELNGAVLQQESRDVTGGDLKWPLPPRTLLVAAYRLDGENLVPGSAVDLREQVADGVLTWRVPEGRHRVIAIRVEPVVPSLDPMNPGSGPAYAKAFFGQFEDRFPSEGGKGLNFFFSDELDFRVSGLLWTARFADEFRKRKGYDIVPELPALWMDAGPRTPKVRLDYADVKVALTEEGFFRPVFEWHQKRGMIYGCDHGGRGRDVTEFGDYFRTQRWNQGPGCDQPALSRDLIKNKVASSIAHLYLRPRVWLEGYHSSGWGTNSADIADATFANFAQGQNLLTFHGLYYSTHGGWWEWAPPCNHFHQPYWAHMGAFLTCVQRISYLLSQGHHRCDVAMLYPVAAVEAGMGGNESVAAAFGAGESLYRRGIDFDFMDFESLVRAQVADRQLQISGEAYRVLVLPAMRAVRFSTLQKALEFQRSGGIVVALGTVPEASDRAGRDDPKVSAIVKELFADGKNVVRTPDELSEILSTSFPRDFTVQGADALSLQFMHRKVGPRDLYMVYGVPRGTECTFRASGQVELWDPWSGATRPLSVVSQTAGATRLRMPLSDKEAQIIVFSPGTPRIEVPEPQPSRSEIALDGDWEFELKPTMDNRWGDYRWPPSETLLGAEARQFRYADETAANPGWQAPDLDDSSWPVVTHSFGPRFWKLGPLPDDADLATVEAELASLNQVDPSRAITLGGKAYHWQPYAFSWRWGIEGDPGHQGYHGLKEQVHDEFIGLGKLAIDATSTHYEKEEGGSRYLLWSSVLAPRDGKFHLLSGGLKPAGIWLDGRRLEGVSGPVTLGLGHHPVLVRYDQPGRGFLIVNSKPEDPQSSTVEQGTDLATRWEHDPSVLPFDTRPGEAHPAGWYRFTSAPGLRGLTITAHGVPRVWVDGAECRVTAGSKRDDGAMVYLASLDAPVSGCARVAIRIEQERGDYGGAALPEPIALDCGAGRLPPGDWSVVDGLRCYSGGAWYRKTVDLTEDQIRSGVELDLGRVVSSAEVRVNGTSAGIRLSPPWRFDVSKLVKLGSNRIEVLVYNTAANHYVTIPTRYHGSIVSGLIGPARLVVGAAH